MSNYYATCDGCNRPEMPLTPEYKDGVFTSRRLCPECYNATKPKPHSEGEK